MSINNQDSGQNYQTNDRQEMMNQPERNQTTSMGRGPCGQGLGQGKGLGNGPCRNRSGGGGRGRGGAGKGGRRG